MIHYIEINLYKTLIYEDDFIKEYDGYESAINLIAKAHLVDLKSYRKLLEKALGISRAIPFYLSESLILFPIKYNSVLYYINYSDIEIVRSISDGIIIIFNDRHELQLKISLDKYKRIDEKNKLVCDYMNNIKKEYSW